SEVGNLYRKTGTDTDAGTGTDTSSGLRAAVSGATSRPLVCPCAQDVDGVESKPSATATPKELRMEHQRVAGNMVEACSKNKSIKGNGCAVQSLNGMSKQLKKGRPGYLATALLTAVLLAGCATYSKVSERRPRFRPIAGAIGALAKVQTEIVNAQRIDR